MIVGIEVYNRLLPARRHTERSAFSAVLAFAVGGPDFLDFYVVNSFHCVPYLSLIGLLIHFEGIRTLNIGKMHPLLGD